MGIGGWLMYEGYKGQSISNLKTKLQTGGQAVTAGGQYVTASGAPLPATRVSSQ